MRIIGWLLAIFNATLLALLIWTMIAPSASTLEKGNRDDEWATAQLLFRHGEFENSLRTIKNNHKRLDPSTDEGRRWLELLIDISENSQDAEQLMLIHLYAPALFNGRERASLLVADGYIKVGDGKGYSRIRRQWHDREAYGALWLLLDADRLLLEGKRSAAIALLEGSHFDSAAEEARLMRLGLMHLVIDPDKAWESFTEALQLAPHDGALYGYRAKLMENKGDLDEAEEQYETGILADPGNSWLREEAVDFYLRSNRFEDALALIAESLSEAPTERLWLKALFWNKVTLPLEIDWHEELPSGTLKPLNRYLLALGDRELWNDQLFASIGQSNLLAGEQATYWLRLLDALQHGREAEAMTMIEESPFRKESWNPALEIALLRLLHYRREGSLHLGVLETSMMANIPNALPPLFQELNKAAERPHEIFSSDLQLLLKSRDGYVALLLEAGWARAALLCRSLRVIPQQFPERYVAMVADAIRTIEGNSKALEFMTLQPDRPALDLMMGELFLQEGKEEMALVHLRGLASREDELGTRAAALLKGR